MDVGFPANPLKTFFLCLSKSHWLNQLFDLFNLLRCGVSCDALSNYLVNYLQFADIKRSYCNLLPHVSLKETTIAQLTNRHRFDTNRQHTGNNPVEQEERK